MVQIRFTPEGLAAWQKHLKSKARPAAPLKKTTPTKRKTKKTEDVAWAWGIPLERARRNPLLRGRTKLRGTLG